MSGAIRLSGVTGTVPMQMHLDFLVDDLPGSHSARV